MQGMPLGVDDIRWQIRLCRRHGISLERMSEALGGRLSVEQLERLERDAPYTKLDEDLREVLFGESFDDADDDDDGPSPRKLGH